MEAAVASGKLSASAAANIGKWLKEPYLRDYAPQVEEHIAAGKWAELEEAFWTTIPFGTGGRRGRMYPIGCNAINDRTIGESAQGLADYIKDQAAAGQPLAQPVPPSGGPPTGPGRGLLRHCLRYAAPVARVRRAVQRNHGGGRLYGLFPRRRSQHARAFLYRAAEAVRLRHHDHRQPQSAQRQCREGVRSQRRTDDSATRCRLDRPDGARDLRPADAVCRGDRRRQGALLPGGDGRGLCPRRARPEPSRPARLENPLLAAARRRGLGRSARALRGRLPRRGALRSARPAGRRFSQRAQARGQSREPGRLRAR